MLTVEATENTIAMFNSNAHPRVYRVKFVVVTNQTQALLCPTSHLHPKLRECEFIVAVNAPGGLGLGYEFRFVDFIPTGARSSILRSRITVYGAHTTMVCIC